MIFHPYGVDLEYIGGVGSTDNMLVSVLSGHCARITWWVFWDIFVVLFLCCVHAVFIDYPCS